jgi:putative zinc finger/helix-turn-helix YgiT family protein
MEELTRCVACKHEGLTETLQPWSRTVAGYTFETKLEALTCPACGESYYSDKTVEAYEMGIATWLARHGIDSGEAFQFMRKTLGLRAVDLASLLDVAPETLSRWEKEHRPTDHKATALLASMVLDRVEGHDRTLQRLRSLQAPAPTENRVDLTLTPVPA